MPRSDDASLAERVERLERLVEELARGLAAMAGRDATLHARAPAEPVLAPDPDDEEEHLPVVGRAAAWIREEARPGGILRWDGQTWLNRLGIVLLLLGVALLFRYSIDQGWLTPLVRVLFGAAVGTILTLVGLRLAERHRYAFVLVGGGVATFYLTGWAAFNLYGLLGYLPAFAAMVAITAGAFLLALWRTVPSLAILGAAGGLGTPLILGISFASPRGLALYTSLILAWTVVPYLRRGWRSVLWTSMAFGWMLLALYANWLPETFRAGTPGKGWIQAATLLAWVLLGVLPPARRVLHLRATPGERERRWSNADALHWYGVGLVPPVMAV